MRHFVAALLLVFCSAAAFAIPIDNPAPGIAGDDEGDELFTPGNVAVGIEILDLAALLVGDPFPAAGFGGSEFGFYYADNPGELITIFDALDQNPDPGGLGDVAQVALINFLTGEVLDTDDGDSIQSTFTSIAGGEIGFFLTLADDLVDFFGFDFNTVYTQSYLNLGGDDMAAAFPLLNDPGFLLGFGAVNPFNADGNTLLLGLHVAVNVTEVVRVPEPSTYVLFLAGLLPLVLLGRRWRVIGTEDNRSAIQPISRRCSSA